MSWLRGMTPSEKRVVKICVLLMLLCLPFLLNEDLLSRFLGRDGETSGVQIGKIANAHRDVRRKGAAELQWRGVGGEEAVFMGDSVFAGENSSAQIELDGKNELTIAPNSLVRFANINGFRVGDMALGKFKVKVDGEVKIAVNGKLKTFRGTKSEIEVSIEKNKKPEIRVTKGAAKVADVPVVKVTAQRQGPPVPKAGDPSLIYIWKWPDYYTLEEPIARKDTRPTEVFLTHILNWGTSEANEATDFGIQLAQRPDFLGPRQHFESETNSVELRRLFLGENYWRVSADRRQWSRSAKFEVKATLLEDRVAAQPYRQSVVVLGEDRPAEYEIKWTADSTIAKILVEVSSTPDFNPQYTRIQWLSEPVLKGNFAHGGTYYFRGRGVNERQEITEYSNTAIVDVSVPDKLSAPKMPSHSLTYNLFSNRTNYLAWTGPAGSKEYQVEVMTEDGSLVSRKSAKAQRLPLKDLTPGIYSYRVTAIDKYERESEPSIVKSFEVMAPPPAPLVVKEPEPPPALKERKLAAVETAPSTNVMQMEDSTIQYLNTLYGDSRLSVEGASFGMMSSEQSYQGTPVPYAATMALRGKHWVGKYGAEGSFKSKVFNYNAEGSRVSPWGFEARMLRRWRTSWKWFSFLRELQITAIAGGELYRNRGNGVFSNGYELMKVGGGLEFPVWQSWATGGEVLYGYGMDASSKLEISGFVNYFIRKQWALGAGYRVHFFEAGSLESTPAGFLPYREGYLEGYSTLRYSY